MEKQASSQGGVSLKIVQDEVRITIKVTQGELALLRAVRQLHKHEAETLTRFVMFLRSEAGKKLTGGLKRTT